jgi:hypothetical protein
MKINCEANPKKFNYPPTNTGRIHPSITQSVVIGIPPFESSSYFQVTSIVIVKSPPRAQLVANDLIALGNLKHKSQYPETNSHGILPKTRNQAQTNTIKNSLFGARENLYL